MKSLGEVATFHDNLFDPNEKTVTLRIKSLIKNNEISKAEQVLTALPVRSTLLFVFFYTYLLLTHLGFNALRTKKKVRNGSDYGHIYP